MGIIGPVFFMLLMLIFEVGYQLAVDMALNIAVSAASRYGITGQGYSNNTRDSMILSTASAIAAGFIDTSKLTVTMASYATPAAFAANGTKTTSTGASSNVVAYTYSYKAYYLTGFPTLITGSNYITHTAALVVQNEPF
jgi:Flp pilus assembly protein TadG